MRKLNVKMPLGSEIKVKVRGYVCKLEDHVWVDDTQESSSGMVVVESTVCDRCGLPWEFRNE